MIVKVKVSATDAGALLTACFRKPAHRKACQGLLGRCHRLTDQHTWCRVWQTLRVREDPVPAASAQRVPLQETSDTMECADPPGQARHARPQGLAIATPHMLVCQVCWPLPEGTRTSATSKP